MHLKELFSQLIACNSISSIIAEQDQGNRNVIDLLANLLGGMGFSCEVMPVAENKANLIATYGNGPGGLVLAGHTDTVPCDPSLWSSDPLQLSERENRWYGLGSCDMKGFFPLIVEAFKQHREATFKQPLIVLATADEETSMDGAKALAAQGRPQARAAVIGEPTGLRPINMHKGMMMEKLVITGSSGHSSNPALGNNALETMHGVMTQLLALRDKMVAQKHPGFAIDHATMNLGCIAGGDNPNRICGHCTLGFEIRPIPGMNLDQLQRDIESQIADLAARDQVGWQLDKLIVPPFQGSDQSQLVALCEQLTGHRAESVAFATEAPFLQQLGMDVVVLGPGNIEQAHQPDEFLAMDRIQPTVDFLAKLIGRYCLQ